MNTIIQINGIDITITTINGEKYVAIKPICEAIGVDFRNQLEKIKEYDILRNVYSLNKMEGADGKRYKMGTIPFKFLHGWLSTINPNNVKPELKNNFMSYQLKCHEALFDSFSERTTLLKNIVK